MRAVNALDSQLRIRMLYNERMRRRLNVVKRIEALATVGIELNYLFMERFVGR